MKLPKTKGQVLFGGGGTGGIVGSVMVVISAAIIIFIGIWVLMLVNSSVSLPTVSYQINNETVNFAAYNTSYNLAHTNIIDSSFVVQNTSLVLNIGNFTKNTTSILMMNTTGMDNYTLGNYFVSYVYTATETGATNAFTNATNISWNAISLLTVALVVMAAAVILGYFGFGLKREE